MRFCSIIGKQLRKNVWFFEVLGKSHNLTIQSNKMDLFWKGKRPFEKFGIRQFGHAHFTHVPDVCATHNTFDKYNIYIYLFIYNVYIYMFHLYIYTYLYLKKTLMTLIYIYIYIICRHTSSLVVYIYINIIQYYTTVYNII